jgi:hypothetical protein
LRSPHEQPPALPAWRRRLERKAAPPHRSEGFPVTANRTVEQIVNTSADALNESGNVSRDALQELAKAYQDLASKNTKTVTAAIRALAAVKSPPEFIELQQKQIRQGVLDTLSGNQRLGQLTAAVVASAFRPARKQIEAVQKIE